MVNIWTVLLLCSTLTAMLSSHLVMGIQVQLEGITSTEQVEHEFDCEQLRGKIENNSEELLFECENIMNSDIVRRTKEYMLNRTHEEMEEAKLLAGSKNPKILGRSKRSTECPVVDAEFLERHKYDTGMRSLSPYEDEFTQNPKRFPRFILQSECLCIGCIDPNSGRETMDYVSELIRVEHRVFFFNDETSKYELGTEELRVGCTCIKPRFT